MKKSFKALLAILLMVTLTACSASSAPAATATPEPTEAVEQETITLTIQVIDMTKDNQILFDGEVTVPAECKTLADVINHAPELNAKTEEGQYGMTILGLMGVEGDWDKGPWWLYESEDNEACAAAGYCDGASNLEVQDGNHFTFMLTSDF